MQCVSLTHYGGVRKQIIYIYFMDSGAPFFERKYPLSSRILNILPVHKKTPLQFSHVDI